MLRIILAVAVLCALTINAEARKRTIVVDPMCNITMPCEGVTTSPRGELVVKAMGGFGTAQKVYKPRAEVIGGRPSGCPRAFCGCGASLQVFGKIIPALNLADNWLRFPRAAPAPGMVAARHGHVFVLKEHLGGNVWLAHDSNSGRHLTRLHPRSIAGYSIVNPHS
jgi:hypothetical protein